MRYVKIFFLHFQHVFQLRARSFVWFLIVLVDASILLLFWAGALKDNTILGVSFKSILSYYLFLVVLSVFLTSHVEADVSIEDIREGRLTQYLTRPISYYWIKFYEETPYRVLQFSYALITLAILFFLFGNFFLLTSDYFLLLLSIVIVLLAYFLYFTYKMIIGIIAFWTIDIGGLFELQVIFILIFAGYLMPISLLPPIAEKIAYILPFSYMIYFPVVAFQGSLTSLELLKVIGIQVFWIIIFIFVYLFLWKKGVAEYTAIGQ